MKMVKSLVLGSAAGLFAMSAGAQAADLPVKAKAVEYVRICSLYGAGFFYIPGTDTCIKIGGYLRADLTIHGGNAGQPFAAGDPGVVDRWENQYNDYARMALTIDTRTQTEYGVVRTFGQGDFTFATEGTTSSIGNQGGSIDNAGLAGQIFNNTVGGGYTVVEFLFIQFAGFTFGKSASAFNTPWHGFPGNNTAYLTGGYDTVTGLNNIQYTAQFGNGVSGTIGVDDSSASGYNRTQIFNATLVPSFGNVNIAQVAGGLQTVTANNSNCNLGGYGTLSSQCTTLGSNYSGTEVPDIVGNIRVDQAWGLFQFSAALHDNTPGYWSQANTINAGTFLGGVNASGSQALGHPDQKFGGAVSAALQFKNLFTGPGDDFKIEGTVEEGASKYVLGFASVTGNGAYIFGNGSPVPLAGGNGITGGKQALMVFTDSVYGGFGTPLQSGLQLTRGWGIRGAFNHNWDPYWSTSLFGGASSLIYNDTAKTLWCASYAGVTPNNIPVTTAFGIGQPTGRPVTITSADFHCDPGGTLGQIGLVTRWTPVKNLTFSGEVMYTELFTRMKGSAFYTPSSGFPLVAGTYQYGNMGTAEVELRVQRNF